MQLLQHYNPIVDEEVHAEWNVPASWKLRAQLVFGSVEGEAKEKALWMMLYALKSSNNQ